MKKYAILPTKLANGTWIWLESYEIENNAKIQKDEHAIFIVASDSIFTYHVLRGKHTLEINIITSEVCFSTELLDDLRAKKNSYYTERVYQN